MDIDYGPLDTYDFEDQMSMTKVRRQNWKPKYDVRKKIFIKQIAFLDVFFDSLHFFYLQFQFFYFLVSNVSFFHDEAPWRAPRKESQKVR